MFCPISAIHRKALDSCVVVLLVDNLYYLLYHNYGIQKAQLGSYIRICHAVTIIKLLRFVFLPVGSHANP